MRALWSARTVTCLHAEPLLLMEGIDKVFPGVVALDGAACASASRGARDRRPERRRQITLMKILNGAYRRDGGTIMLDGAGRFRLTRNRRSAGASARSTRRSISSRFARWPRTSSWAASRGVGVFLTGGK